MVSEKPKPLVLSDPELDTEAVLENIPPRPRMTLAGRLLSGALIVAILGVATATAAYWMLNRPTAQRRPPQREARLVEVMTVEHVNHPVIVRAMGTVVPARQIQLAARVSGQVVSIDDQFVPGGHFTTGQRICQIDPADYQLAVRQRQYELVRARSDLTVEMGQQSVAAQEADLLGSEIQEGDRELILRKPQLAMAQAAVDAAEAALERARLDLERTNIPAPFNAMVRTREINLGSQVSVNAPLATLVGTDEYWIETLVPVDELQWIAIPGLGAQTGSTARVYDDAWGSGAFRTGRVYRLMTGLEPEGRMARVLISVSDPHLLRGSQSDGHLLLLDAYVRVEIVGRELDNVVEIPRSALRPGDGQDFVWIYSSEKTLEVRPVHVGWAAQDHVYIREGLTDGELLVTSDLAAPVPGMPLRLPGATTAPATGAAP